MRSTAEVVVLTRSLKRSVAVVALLALLFAQAAAGLHAVRHLRAGNDSAGVPDAHSQLCLACASFAPLASAHGGATSSLGVAALGVDHYVRAPAELVAAHRPVVLFRSRAPPG